MFLHIFHIVWIIKNIVISKSVEKSLRDLFDILTRFIKSTEICKLFVIIHEHNHGIDVYT